MNSLGYSISIMNSPKVFYNVGTLELTGEQRKGRESNDIARRVWEKLKSSFLYGIRQEKQDLYETQYQDKEETRAVSVFDIYPEGEIFDFCLKENLFGQLNIAMGLIGDFFPDIRKVDLALKQDPEFDDQWLVIRIEVDEDVGELLSQYEEYIEHWINLVSKESIEKIRLELDML